MTDREKVIEELDKIADEVNPWKESPPLRCDIPYPLLCDAIALLKEQEDLGAELTNAVELIRKKNKRIEELLKEQEPKTGRWIDSAGADKCSVCGATYSDLYPDYQHTHYCPNCGAKMIVQEVKRDD